jgi:hypothetical protein
VVVPVSIQTFRDGMWQMRTTCTACLRVAPVSTLIFRYGMWSMPLIWPACFMGATRWIAHSWRPGLCLTGKVSRICSPHTRIKKFIGMHTRVAKRLLLLRRITRRLFVCGEIPTSDPDNGGDGLGRGARGAQNQSRKVKTKTEYPNGAQAERSPSPP